MFSCFAFGDLFADFSIHKQQRRHPRRRSLHRQQDSGWQRHFFRQRFRPSQRQRHWREQRFNFRFSIWFSIWRGFWQWIFQHRQQLFRQRLFHRYDLFLLLLIPHSSTISKHLESMRPPANNFFYRWSRRPLLPRRRFRSERTQRTQRPRRFQRKQQRFQRPERTQRTRRRQRPFLSRRRLRSFLSRRRFRSLLSRRRQWTERTERTQRRR
jgi:hypothetical protein